MNNMQFKMAIQAGLILVNSEASAPTKIAKGIVHLEQLLIGLAEGKLSIQAVPKTGTAEPEMPNAETPEPPTPQDVVRSIAKDQNKKQ